jgi:hypothetical protein
MADLPAASAKIDTGDCDRFTEFARRIQSVPHSEIKAKQDAVREPMRAPRSSVAARLKSCPDYTTNRE